MAGWVIFIIAERHDCKRLEDFDREERFQILDLIASQVESVFEVYTVWVVNHV